MPVLQKSIAQKAGVSYATVSRALTNSAKVAPKTMLRIRNAMQELGVDIDNLLLGSEFTTRAVLLVVSDISNHFYSSIVKGVYEGLTPLGYSVVLCNYGNDKEQELAAMVRAAENNFAGIIMVTVSATDEMIQFLQSTLIPVVLVNRYIQELDLDVVRIDNYRGGYMAGQHLIDCGHRRIVHLAGVKGSGTAIDRARGLRDALENNGINFSNDDIFYGDNSSACGRHFADWLLQRGADYTAVFVGNDYMAVGLVRRLLQLGKRVPEDYSIISFDESILVGEDGLNITTISSDAEKMGQSAANVFHQRRTDLLGKRFRTVYSPQLNIRGSVRKL